MTRTVRATVGSIVLVLSVAAGLSAPADAKAATDSKTFTLTKLWKAQHSCISVTLSGTMTATWNNYYANGNLWQGLRSPRLVAPRMAITVYPNGTCTGAARLKVTKATLTQSWYYDTCSLNPSIGVSIPFAIGISATPTCGSKRAAVRKTSYGKGSSFAQNNSGTVATWNEGASQGASTCVHGVADVTNFRGTTSYSKRMDMGKVCLKATP